MNVPDHLTTAVRAAADAAPPHSGDLAAVRRRGRARRRHRAVTGTGLVAVAIAAAVGTPFALVDPAPAPVAPPPAASTTESADPAPPPTQRLLLTGSSLLMDLVEYTGERPDEGLEPPPGTTREKFEWYRDQPDMVGVLGPLAELRPDGTVVELVDLAVLPGVDSVQQLVAMPDGRLAAFGLVDLMPGVERTDGPCVEGIATPLLVLERDGSVSLSRDLRVRCQTLRLVAADAGTAYLLRDSRLVAHDLATGAERGLLDSAPTEGAGLDYRGGRLAMLTRNDQPSCGPGTIGRTVLRVVEVAGGASVDHPVPAGGCTGSAGPLRLSPDGRYAAYGYVQLEDRAAPAQQLRVAIVDLDRGTVVEDRLVAEAAGGSYGTYGWLGIHLRNDETAAGLAGLAWDDPQTLRLAWYEVPRDGVHWLPDVVQQTTVTVHP